MALFSIYAAVFSQPGFAQFETRSNRSVPNNEYAIAVGDFNGDGKMDAALAGNELFILLGNGDGTFQAPVGYFIPALSIAVADFNGDGIPDIVLGDESTISVLLGKGDGTFQPPVVTTVNHTTSFLAVGDFNNDHKPDVVIVDDNFVSVLLGNGDGSFQIPNDTSYVGAGELAVGDFNNDHKLDVVAVGSFFGSSEYGVMLGNGDGTLQPPVLYSISDPPGAVSTADFNNDGKLDLAIGAYLGGGVDVLLGNGDGTFQALVNYPSPTGGPIVIGDFNDDGNLDMAVGSSLAAGVQEFLGAGNGSFATPIQYDSGTGGVPIVSDFNNDGRPDLALLAVEAGITTMLNTGSLLFSPSAPIVFPVQVVNTTSVPKALTLTNSGTVPISLKSIKSTGNFAIADGCGAVIPPGISCSLSITCEPKKAGGIRGSITLIDGSPKPQVMLLSGESTPFQFAPSKINFGSQKVGTTSAPKKITLTNVSETAVAIKAIQIGGNDNNDFNQTNTCGSKLAGGASCSISVTFTPNKLGSRVGNINIALINLPNPPVVVIAGTGS
jgi:FG-GAP-like repeat/Abnormal spindle-like microcephaly-assoc'd, ASPM-SPD-2-Hydin